MKWLDNKGENTLSNRKSYTASLETGGSTVRKPEHPNSDAVEENDTKNNFMEMIEVLKKEMKKSLTEMEEKMN